MRLAALVVACGLFASAAAWGQAAFLPDVTTPVVPPLNNDINILRRAINENSAAISSVGRSIGIVNVTDYGAKGDGIRVPCLITSVASSTSVTIAPGNALCAFTAADVGKKIVIFNAGSTVTASLATTISAVTDVTHITVAAAPGQTLAASNQYVVWGTDNAAAINAAYVQAAQQTDASGQQGYVYFPPLPKPQINTSTIRCWGVASQINSAPGNFQIDTRGAGREASTVCALAPMAILLNGSSAFSRAAAFSDIGFDGNALATDTMKFACLPHGRLTNVLVANPAAGGRALNIGNAFGCNTTQTYGLFAHVDGTFYPSPASYPDSIVYIDNSDTQHYGLIAVGPATTASINLTTGATNTLLVGPHLYFQAGTYGIRTLAALTQIYYPQIDFGPGPSVGVSLAGGAPGLPQMVHGGHMLAPDATAVGVQVEAGTRPAVVEGFYCGNFGTPANCIKEVVPDGFNLIYGNPNAIQKPQYTQVANQSPTGPTSTVNYTFMGLGVAITPQSSGWLSIAASATTFNTVAANGAKYKIVVGTGTPPTNNQNCVTGGGATVWVDGSPLQMLSNPAGQYVPLTVTGEVQTNKGTAYWVDLCGQLTGGGVANLFNVDLKVKELGVRQ